MAIALSGTYLILYAFYSSAEQVGHHTYKINALLKIAESQTIEEFGYNLNLDPSDVEHLRSVFMAVENGDLGMLKSLGIKDSELGDVKFFLEKLVNTGFLD